MIKITTEELVRYLYNETSVEKTAVIKSALQNDWNLRETYEKLVNAHTSLDEIKCTPRPQVVNKILEYAAKKQTHLHSL